MTNTPPHILAKIREAKSQRLKELDLSNKYETSDGEKLTEIPVEVFELTWLEKLNLDYNKITVIPEAIAALYNLTKLYLFNNQIKVIPEALTALQNLTELDLNGNQITVIPEAIAFLPKLKKIKLGGNPLENPPIEVAKQGIEAIREYFRQTAAAGVDYLYEAKLLIVGEPGAGKTTLNKKIINANYQLKEEDSTQGIEVTRWQFPLENGRQFQVNIWDFGGQEIYHATHQFFLTKRSLYALVADTRKEDTDFYYWLNAVELLSDNSPLLIVANEKQDRHREINERQLRGEFTNLQETIPVNFATNRGLPELFQKIRHHLTSLPHIGSALPKTWVRVRQVLELESRPYITLDEYLKICEQNGFTRRDDKLQLSRYLHDLGVCLHFQDEPLLEKLVILKPKWGTDAVYKVLDNKQVIKNYGRFSKSDLANIWHEDKYAQMHSELLQLMIKFQLCYEIPNSRGNYIAPQLLNENQPQYPWNESNNLILRYTYPDFMPKGILTQTIVAMHKLIDQQQYVWKSGVILKQNETLAEVIENYGKREIKIRISGRNQRDLLTVVTYELDKIHASYPRLKYNKLIPCSCATCKGNQEPHFYDFEILRKFAADRKEIQCLKSYDMVDPLGLIDNAIGRENFLKAEQSKYGDFAISGNVENVVIYQGVGVVENHPESKNHPKPEPNVTLPFAFRNGLFYLFLFVIIFYSVAIFAGILPLYSLAFVIISTVIIIALIGALQLRQDNRLSEKSFIELMKMVLEQLPLIGNLMKQFKGK